MEIKCAVEFGSACMWVRVAIVSGGSSLPWAENYLTESTSGVKRGD